MLLKNQIVILSVSKALNNFGILMGRSNPEYQIMKYLLEHFYQNEMLAADSQKIAQQLRLPMKTVKAFLQRLVKAHVLIYKKAVFYLNTNFVLNR